MHLKTMKHLKLFESFKEEDIRAICQKYEIENYIINEDGSIDVDGSVKLTNMYLTKLPLKFRNVTGYFACNYNLLSSLEGCPKSVGDTFYCWHNQLTSLKGCPKLVGNDFRCDYNQLTSLEGAPQSVGGYFMCESNQLTSLEGCPEKVGGGFFCGYNNLTSLEGCPESVGGNFNCHGNQLTSLEGCPKSVGHDFCCTRNKIVTFEHLPLIGSTFYCEGNPIYHIWKLFRDYDKIEFLNDCDALREPNIVILDRLNYFLEEIGKPKVTRVYGYQCLK